MENQFETSTQATLGTGFIIAYLAILLLGIIIGWKIFVKAGKPGWASIIPIYNVIVLLEIVGRPTWWVILLFVPFVNFVILIIGCLDLAKSFGKSTAFGIGLFFLNLIFAAILAFGDATYQGPSAQLPNKLANN
ncbi:DUF5684 domain-containing protein [Solitalea sp. MAHUQ-68]|uniref:DUF5684 domain-containing protein n=1 Tax=Solitalea agri TaxID=2953739 RepID=A0A9X2EZQ1_9SPHI|nr:DUF5684 domain-containing protein [Solitalea agri]MCO4291927.1 DUF5684 domain-containing protein [Solitalea agri]